MSVLFYFSQIIFYQKNGSYPDSMRNVMMYIFLFETDNRRKPTEKIGPPGQRDAMNQRKR